MKTKISLFSLILLAFLTACSGNSAIVKKGESFNKDAQKVVTLSAYNLVTKSAPADDAVLSKYQAYISSAMGDIYGKLIPGGIVIDKIAKELGVQDKFELVLGKMTEFALNPQGAGLGEMKKIMVDIAAKAGVDAFAFPVVTGGKEIMTAGQKIDLYVIVYDLKTDKIQFMAKNEVIISSLALKGAQGDQEKLTKLAESQILSAASDMMDKVKKDLFESK